MFFFFFLSVGVLGNTLQSLRVTPGSTHSGVNPGRRGLKGLDGIAGIESSSSRRKASALPAVLSLPQVNS